MYAVYHEHFEISNWGDTIRVTCVCGKDFIWGVGAGMELRRCPHCSEKWVLGLVEGYITVTREKTGAKAKLALDRNQISQGLINRLFPPCK